MFCSGARRHTEYCPSGVGGRELIEAADWVVGGAARGWKLGDEELEAEPRWMGCGT